MFVHHQNQARGVWSWVWRLETPAVLYAAKSTEDTRGSIPTQLDDGRDMAEREGWESRAIRRRSRDALDAAIVVRSSLRRWRTPSEIAPCVLVSSTPTGSPAATAARPATSESSTSGRSRPTSSCARSRTTRRSQPAADVRDGRAQRGGLPPQVARGRRPGCGAARRPASRTAARAVRLPLRERRLVVVDAEAAIVRRIFSEFLAGRSLTAIARGLHQDGMPTLRGGLWRQSTVGGILRTRLRRPDQNGDELFHGDMSRSIDQDDWQRAQDDAAARRAEGPRPAAEGPPPVPRRDAALRMRRGDGAPHERRLRDVLLQRPQKFGRTSATIPHLRRVDIDEPVYRYFEQVGLDVEATRASSRTPATARWRSRALREQARAGGPAAPRRLARVRRDYMDGKLGAEDWPSSAPSSPPRPRPPTRRPPGSNSSEAEVRRNRAMFDAEQATLER